MNEPRLRRASAQRIVVQADKPEPVVALPYAARVRHIPTTTQSILLGLAIGATVLSFWSAFEYGRTYLDEIARPWSRSVIRAEAFSHIAAGGAVVLSALALVCLLGAKSSKSDVRLSLLLLFANGVSFLTPWLWDFRADVWPH